MKRIKRKQLKEDEFVTTINKIIRFIKKRTKELIALVVIVLIGILIFAGVRFVKSRINKREARTLSQIIKLNSELNDNPDSVEKLEELAGGGKFSALANVYLATYWIENGDFDRAISLLEKVEKGKKDIFYFQAKDLLAKIYMRKKNYDKAIEIYKRIEEDNPSVYSLDVILFNLAEAYEKKGDVEGALALYKRIKEQFPMTSYGYDASQKVLRLEKEK
ncbi:MAG: tetratricopeptide repeat protein [Candidatus Aminicenantaceae bacterium]